MALIVCPECGKQISEYAVSCPYCGLPMQTTTPSGSAEVPATGTGKNSSKFKRILVRSILIFVILSLAYLAIHIAYNRYKALDAASNLEFKEAKRYYDNLLIADKLFPDDYAYVKAGVLLEQEDYVEALAAFEALDNYDVPAAVIDPLREKLETIYSKGIQEYSEGNYAYILVEFPSIAGYRDCDDYLFLCNYRIDEYIFSEDIDRLLSLVGFADANSLILESTDTALAFLDGYWENGDLYLQIERRSRAVHSNLPNGGLRDASQVNSADLSTYPSGTMSFKIYQECENNPHFRFSIVDTDTVNVFCYEDGNTYTLSRKK